MVVDRRYRRCRRLCHGDVDHDGDLRVCAVIRSNTLRPALWAIVAILLVWFSILAAAFVLSEPPFSLLSMAAVEISASIGGVGAAAAGAKGIRDAVGDWSRRGGLDAVD